MKKISLTLLIVMQLFFCVQPKAETNTENFKEYNNMEQVLFDINNKKICQFYVDYNEFNKFIKKPTKDYLYNLFVNNFCYVIEYTLENNYEIVSKSLSSNLDYYHQSYEVTELYDTFNGLIGYNELNNIKASLKSDLYDKGINDDVVEACIINTDERWYPYTVYYVLTNNDIYFIEYDLYEINVYNKEEFFYKYSLKCGSFIKDEKIINNIVPLFTGNDSYISIRDFLENVGCNVFWNSEMQVFSFTYKGKTYQSKNNILSDIYDISTGEKVFMRTWTPAYSGININDKLYYKTSEVNLFAQKMFYLELTADIKKQLINCKSLS